LLWDVNFGDKVDFLQRRAERTGKQPPALQSRPKPDGKASYYLNAFYMLSGSRRVTDGGVGLISCSEIYAYSMLAGINSADDRLDLLEFISFCDDVYISELKRKVPKNAGRKQPKSRGGQHRHGSWRGKG